jgi:hypothetical protein
VRTLIATDARLIANGIAIIGLVRTVIATVGQKNGRFLARSVWLPKMA